ncbi:filamentous hemagglutinin N-terminal domain-containing protein [Sphingomonas sp. 2R-10]|uniref:filamentous hemagglutinin N-terminal domain-containing protein n=1 Tax=Sphingomonas sp. 2R-10 TaxID=3045148 RepID=UPI000F7858F1|nr:filamentous hemagglutinin N-terminal domain-containing protein [Sphingomonas sp. 2R-10]MDJ0276641.1 filamentous hemagglutinin N-terminal domain-containing protein [Sphingomonas sp. 2R-10]
MPVAATARRLRALLAITTACGALFPAIAVAQSAQVRLPTENDVRGIRTDGITPGFRDSSDKLQVDLRGRNTVINWDGFNIPEGKEIDFKDGRLLGVLRGDIAVLNRDVSTRPSQLLGKLSSDANVAVWVHNANGILVGSKAAFNTGSLVLTTLDITPDDFLSAGNSYRLQGAAGSQAGITVQQGAKLRVDGSTRGLVMVAPKIDAYGEFVANGQDVAFVTASDVTLDYRSGSPLSVTLNRGSAVAGTSQYVRGTVAGNNAIFALASQDTLTDSLLQVSAAVTTASAGSRGIVLSAGKTATPVDGVTVAGDATTTGGLARLLVDGALRTDNMAADVTMGASGAVNVAGAVQTRGQMTVAAGGVLTMAGNVTAGGNVLLSGRGVVLGGVDSVTQRTDGQFRVSSTDGDITGIGAVTLRSGDTGDDGLLLETLGTTGGNIVLGSDSRLIAGDDRSGGLTLRRRDTANTIDIGAVEARTLLGAVGTGAVVTGDIYVREALSIGGASVATGDLASGRAIDVRGSGAVTTGGLDSGAGIDVVAGGLLTVGGDVFAGEGVALRGGSVALDGRALLSGGAIDVTALSGGITGSRALAIASGSSRRSDVIKLQAAGAQGIVLADGSSITGGTNRVLDVRIFSAGEAPLKLGDVTARSLGTVAALDDATAAEGAFRSTGSLTFGRLDLVDGFTAESTGGDLTVGRIAVSGALQGIDLRAAGTLSVQNDIATSGAVTLASGSALTLGVIESRDRAVTLTSGGALRAARVTAATGVTASGSSATLGEVRGGTGAVLLSATAGDLTLGSAAGRRVALDAAAGGVGVTGTLTADAGAVDVAAAQAISVAGAVRSTGGNVRIVSSGGPIAVTGGLASDGAATLSGTAITLGGAQSARGAYSASATAGGITRSGPGVSIRSDSDASGGEGVTLSAAGGAIDLLDTRIDAGGTVRLTTDGQGIVFGAVQAAGLVATGATAAGAPIRTGDLNIAGPVTLRAAGDVATGVITTDGAVTLAGNAIRFGDARAASLSAIASGGDAIGGNVDTTGAVDVQAAAGALTLGRVVTTQGDVALTALGPVFVQAVNAGGTASVVGTGAGNDVSVVEGVASNGAVTVRSGRDIRTPFVRSATGALTVAAPNGRLAGFAAGTGTNLSAGAGQPFSLTIGTDAVLGDVVGGNISITATAITANRIDGGALPVALNATVGDLIVTGPVTGSTIALTAAGRALLGSVDASGAVTLGGARGLSFDRVSGASITATGGTIAGNALTSTGVIALRGADVTLERIDGGTLEADATGILALGTVAATGAATLKGGTGRFGSVTTGGALDIATAGDLRFDRLTGRGVTAVVQDGALAGAAVVATGGAALRGQSIDVGSVQSGGSLSAAATAGGLRLGTIAAGGNATLQATGAATLATVTTGGAYRVTAGSIALDGVQRAGGDVRLVANAGGITGTSGLTLVSGTAAGAATGDVPIVLDATGGIDLSGATLRTGAGSAVALGAGRGQAIRLGTVEAGSLGGFDGTAPTDRLTHDGSVTTGDLTLGRLAVTLTSGDLTTGRIAISGPVSLIANAGSIRGGGDLTAASLEARAGTGLSFGTATVGGVATLEAGAIDLRALTAQALTIRTAGVLGAADGGATSLRTTGSDLNVDAGTARLGSVESAGAATLRGGAIEVRERLSAARALLVEARSALTLQNVGAGGDLSLKSDAVVSAGELSAGGALSVDGAGVTLGAARAGGALKVTSSGALSLASGSGNGITLDAAGLIRAGALTGGPSVSIRGADAELSGAIRASSVRFATRDPGTTALRIGDGTQADGFRLSAGEVAQVAADTLSFDSGAGTMEVGGLTLAPGVGRLVEMWSTGDVRVTGQVAASGTGRTIRIGGDGANGNAATIHLIATSDAGGRLLLGDNDLDLRGNRIAAGLAPGFLDTLAPGDAGRAQAQALIGNPNSPLYNAQLGGGFFAPDATTMIAARSLSVRFGDYALFQNTAVPGRSSGVVVGSLTTPVTPALRIATFGNPAAASFAFFGEINGITGAGAALLGNPVIDIQPALLPNSRINGCLAGSGAGCLTTIVIQPTLQVFDWDSQAVFGILQDVSLPFTPIIGGNNEALLSGLPALAPETPADAAAPAPIVAAPPQQEPKP